MLLFCHSPQVPVGEVLIRYCVVQPFGAVVALTVMLFIEGVPTTERCAGGLVLVRVVAVYVISRYGLWSAAARFEKISLKAASIKLAY